MGLGLGLSGFGLFHVLPPCRVDRDVGRVGGFLLSIHAANNRKRFFLIVMLTGGFPLRFEVSFLRLSPWWLIGG